MILCHLATGEKTVTELESAALRAAGGGVAATLAPAGRGAGDAPARGQGDPLPFDRQARDPDTRCRARAFLPRRLRAPTRGGDIAGRSVGRGAHGARRPRWRGSSGARGAARALLHAGRDRGLPLWQHSSLGCACGSWPSASRCWARMAWPRQAVRTGPEHLPRGRLVARGDGSGRADLRLRHVACRQLRLRRAGTHRRR